MIQRHLAVHRTARLQILGVPGEAVRELWIACHGYGQLAADFIRPFEAIATPERLIIAPEALNRFYHGSTELPADQRRVGATWMTREDREAEIADYVAYLDTVLETMRAELPRDLRTHVLGFSQAVTTVVRWIALGRARVDRLTLWAGGLPHDLTLRDHAAKFTGTRVTLVAGTRDRLLSDDAIEAALERLRGAGITPEYVSFAGGHRLDDAVLRQLAEER